MRNGGELWGSSAQGTNDSHLRELHLKGSLAGH